MPVPDGRNWIPAEVNLIPNFESSPNTSALMAQPGDLRVVQARFFRFGRGKIVEYWDVTQNVLADSPNRDGLL